MAKKASKSKPSPKKSTPSPKKATRQTKPAARKPSAPTPVARSAQKSAPAAPAPKPSAPMDSKMQARAKAMAAFSSKVLQEEEAPVAVRSFIEARQGGEGAQQYLPKTGEVTPSTAAPRPSLSPSSEPRAEPLSGPAAVPRPQTDPGFQIRERTAPKKGTKAVTPEDFGQVELRQATASGTGRHLTTAKPENLQRGAERIKPLASGEDETPGNITKKPGKDRFQVGGGNVPQADLSDFGEVEIGQQTLKGSKKIGTLQKDEE